MNSIFNNNYILDGILYKNVMKFYQSCVITPPFLDVTSSDADKNVFKRHVFDCSEFVLDIIDYHQVQSKELILCLLDFTKKQEDILFLPIITSWNESSYTEKPGHYCIDMENESLIRYSNLNSEYLPLINVSSMSKYTVSLFLDLQKAVALYEEIGFIRGILQIGELINYLQSNLKCFNIVKKLRIPQQVLTHQLGINNTEMLFIANISVEKKTL